jgi:hypothetical protein
MPQQQLDHGIGRLVVRVVQPKFRERRVLADEVGDRVLKLGDDVGQRGAVGLGLEVFDDVELDAELLRDGQSVYRTVSIRIVKDRCLRHDGQPIRALAGGLSHRSAPLHQHHINNCQIRCHIG